MALGVVDENNDEDEDEDGDDEGGDPDGSLRSRFIADGRGSSGGNEELDARDASETATTADPLSGGGELTEEEARQQRLSRRHSMRRGR